MRLDLPMDRSLSSGMFQRRNVTWKAKGSVHRDGSSRSHTNLVCKTKDSEHKDISSDAKPHPARVASEGS